jgi:DNA (cytosine-5)-methyltransferase 1
LFEGIDHGSHFTCRWFFRVEDTVCVSSMHVFLFFFLKAIPHVPNTNLQVISPKLLEVNDHKHDRKRVFLSEEKNDNMIESIISKVNIIYVSPNVSALFFSFKFMNVYYILLVMFLLIFICLLC